LGIASQQHRRITLASGGNRVYGHASKQCPHAVPATVTVEEHQGFVRAPEIIAKTILAPADEFSSAYALILGRYNFTDFLRLNLLDRSYDIHTSGIAAMSQSPSQSVAERRTNARERRLWGAKIVFNNNSSSFDCVVRDLSPQGARLCVANQMAFQSGLI